MISMTMRLIANMRRALGRLKRLYRNRGVLDEILLSGNFPFVCFARPGHFYSPLPDMSTVRRHALRIFGRIGRSVPGIEPRSAAQIAMLEEFGSYYDELPFSPARSDAGRYHLDNPYFSFGDAVILYGMLRKYRPRRVIEVGSGYSSAAMLDVDEAFFAQRIEFLFIEPYPDRLYQLLTPSDRARHRIEEKPVQEIPLDRYAKLEAGDILFVDSSHVAKVDSDLLHLLFQVLPSLNNGVIVHFHDVLWPFEYPEIWIMEGRAWNEAYMLRAFLQYNDAFEIVYFNSYMEHEYRELLEKHLPLALVSPSARTTIGNSSLWIRKK